jgi:signal transduction histidine kinase
MKLVICSEKEISDKDEKTMMPDRKILQKEKNQRNCEGEFFRDINVEFLIHELKDPLSVIETAVRMLIEKPNKYGVLTDRQNKTLYRALKNATKARDLLADLLEVGRSDAGCFQCFTFDPVAAVDESLLSVLEATDNSLWDVLQEIGDNPARLAILNRHGIYLSYSMDTHYGQMCQDEIKFKQIVGNLIKNGLQHRNKRLEISLALQEDELIVEVLDDGPGVEEKHRELIFKRYTRLNPSVQLSRTGHGLGLAGARILARHLGGDIAVSSKKNEGTAFCLSIPMNFPERK